MNNVAAGIVLYNPDFQRLFENINAIITQVNYLILIDNGSNNIKEIEEKLKSEKKIIFKKNKGNLGISKALNQIIKVSEEKKCEWVLTLDQDSVCSSNLIRDLMEFSKIDKIGIITPKIVDRNNLEKTKGEKEEKKFTFVERCITSGSLINVKISREINYFDEKMFIDLVDFEYCTRVRKAGYRILRVNSAKLLHQLGDLKVYEILKQKIHVTNHNHLRNYYYARNSIYYLKKHKNYLSKSNVYLTLLKKTLKIILFEKEKYLKLKSIFAGIRSGFKMTT